MTDTIQTETNVLASREIFVPLNKLKKSPRNARKVPHGEAAIEALAASIHHKGLIQNLVVEPEMKGDKPTGSYFVTAGEGRMPTATVATIRSPSPCPTRTRPGFRRRRRSMMPSLKATTPRTNCPMTWRRRCRR